MPRITRETPLDGLGLVLEARGVLLTGVPAWAGAAQRGARRDHGPHRPPPVPHLLCHRLLWAQVLRDRGTKKTQQCGQPQGLSGPISPRLPHSAAQLETGSSWLTPGTGD